MGGEIAARVRSALPEPVRAPLRRARDRAIRALRAGFERVGYNLARRGDCYSPLPVVSELARHRERWARPSALAGIDYDLGGFERLLVRLLDAYGAEFAELPAAPALKARGMGPGFPPLDAFVLYALLRDARPRRYLEVGSGVSTAYARCAAAANEREGHPLAIRCIEPRPYPGLRAMQGIELDARPVQDVPLDRFAELGSGDVLFIDSSHVLKLDGDVPYLYLEVLPRLARGVLVHVHDVPFPYNAPHPADHWVLQPSWPMFWNEAMVLQAFLCFNDRFEIVMSTPLLRHFREDVLKAHVPRYRGIDEQPDTFSSIWLRRSG